MLRSRTGHNAVISLAMLLGCSMLSPVARADERRTVPLASAETQISRADMPLEEQFREPPASARPRVWWHWLNGNITEDGIRKDLNWMKRVGLGGVQNFDAFVPAPQIVDHSIVYMSPEWRQAFRVAAEEAARLDLELGIATSPGWSATGGPWVTPPDGMKKLVWSETQAKGGRRFWGKLPSPPATTGPFQTLPKVPDITDMMWGAAAPKHGEPPVHYADVAVLAVPAAAPTALPTPRVSLHDGSALVPATLFDDDLESGIDIPRGSAKTPSAVVLDYGRKQTLRAATLYVAGAKLMHMTASLAPVLEASDDRDRWREIVAIPADEVPTTVSFGAVTARYFRVVFKPAPTPVLDLGAPAPGVALPADAASFMKAMAAPWKLRQLSLSGEARIDQFETKAGFAVAQDYFALPRRGDGASGPTPHKVIDLTSHVTPDGTLDWTPPPGDWRIVRIGYSLTGTTNHPARPEATGLEVDKFDADAVRRYLERYIATYRDAVGDELIGKRGVRALVSDSIEAGPSNWTPRMIEHFRRLRGYDPVPWLPTLAGVLIGSRLQSDKFLFDYRRTLSDLTASEHYRTIAGVAHENGLKIYGEALETRRPSLGDDMEMRRHADVPMAAMWTFARNQKPNPTLVADIRGAASVAHIYGQNVVAAESMTSALNYWNDSPATLKRVIDLEFVNGVNLPIVHTSAHSPNDSKLPGISLFYFGQFFNRHETWGEMARPWVDYIARNSLLLQHGVNVADLAYFHGEEAPLTGLYGNVPVADAPKTHAYDFVNADALATALRNDGDALVTPGGARYRALYLGGSTQQMSLATLRRVAALVEGGATVIGMPPQGDPGLGGDAAEYREIVARLWPGSGVARVGSGRVVATRDVESALAGIGVAPQFHFVGAADADIPFVHRRSAEGESYFLVNRQNRPETFEARFRVTGRMPEIWRAERGTTEPVGFRTTGGETLVDLTLAPEESIHVVFRKPAKAPEVFVKPVSLVPAAELTGPWTVTFQPGRGAPPRLQVAELAPLNESSEPGVKYFSGIAAYMRSFAAPSTWRTGQPLWLDLGEVSELAEVRVNGKHAGGAWHAPYRVDIGPFLHRGSNVLEVRVANLWVNRLIGDAQQNAAKIAFTAVPAYERTAPLRRSGLIGPVRLLTVESR